MRHQEIAGLIEKLTASIKDYIPPRKDPEVYALLQAVTAAFASNDEKGTLQATRQIEQHALFRYVAVVELAGELCRRLEAH